MASLQFLGAAGTVTGSRFLLGIDKQKFLIDCGLFQGKKENRLRNWEPFPVDPAQISRIFLTHAHIDHTGYLPRFCRDNFNGKIHCTHATHELTEIMLRDSAHLQEEDARWANKRHSSKHSPALPLYTREDAEKVSGYFDALHYGQPLFLGKDLRVKFRNAGHILGSSYVEFKRMDGSKSKKILFSGDFGRPDRAVLRDPVQVYNVDHLVLESTYGNRLHGDEQPVNKLIQVIHDSIKRRGMLIIPSFSVGRTQTILYLIRRLEEENKIPRLPVYMDSPMAIAASEVFEKNINDLNLTARKFHGRGLEIFKTHDLHICKTRDESKAINQVAEKGIIISASGMVTGGRILHHMQARLPYRQNTVLFIGYQAEGTRGRAILDGKDSVKIFGSQVPVNAHIESISGFSGHGDYEEILAWLSAFNHPPKMTYLVHGESDASNALAGKIRRKLGWKVTVPEMGQKVEFEF